MDPIKDIRLDKNIKASELVSQMFEGGGFTAKKIKVGAEIFKNMINDKDCFTFLSFPACTIATGMRGVVKDLVKDKKVDAIITTCGMLDHDFARIWKDYYQGDFVADDAKLREKGICRLGNVFVPDESYGIIIEKKLMPIIGKIYEKEKNISTKDFIWKIGEAIKDEEGVKDSIIYWAWKNQIPVFVPGITDGSVGFQLYMFWQDGHKDFVINVLKDEDELASIVYGNKKTGALMIGGGISKHHTIWWNQFKDGLDFAVYITTAIESDGSLSGARLREAISWGKVKPKAKRVTIEGDATVILPMLVAATL
jgi:deoxyhypusine synthase